MFKNKLKIYNLKIIFGHRFEFSLLIDLKPKIIWFSNSSFIITVLTTYTVINNIV